MAAGAAGKGDKMYRQYEDPYALEERLEKVKAAIAVETDEDSLMSLAQEKAELEDRINFAWQDIYQEE